MMTEASTDDGVSAAEIDVDDIDSGSTREDTSEPDERPPVSIPLDQVFAILKNQRRRYVLQFLYEADGKVSLSDVAEQIAAWENSKDIKQITSSERKRVYVGLYQCHLPKMDGADVVSFNKPRGTIELGENADALYEYIDTGQDTGEPPWHLYSVALSVVSALALGTALVLGAITVFPIVDLTVGAVILTFSAYSLFSIGWIRRNDPGDENESVSDA